MPVKFICDLVAVIPVSFQGDDGMVDYNEFYFVNTDDDGQLSMIRVNSKQNFKMSGIQESRKCEIVLRIDPSGKFKPYLTSVTPIK